MTTLQSSECGWNIIFSFGSVLGVGIEPERQWLENSLIKGGQLVLSVNDLTLSTLETLVRAIRSRSAQQFHRDVKLGQIPVPMSKSPLETSC
jgi:hypothetical protein